MSSKPILYGHIFSPAVRAVLMVSKELNVDLEFKSMDLMKKEHMTPEFLQMNPLHTIPVMKHGDVVASDSHSILMYLVDKFVPDSPLFPKDLAKRTEIINKLMLNAAFLFRRLTDITVPLFVEGNKEVEKHEPKFLEAYDVMETFLGIGITEYFAGPELTIADLTIVATLSAMEIFFPISEKKYPKISHWYQKMQKLTYYEDLNQKGNDYLKGMIHNALSK